MTSPPPEDQKSWRRQVAEKLVIARRIVPPGWRLPVGLLLIVCGFLGFLPVLGFWMVPLGVAVAALDVKPLWDKWQGRQ